MNLHIDVVWKSPIIVVSATAEIHYFREGNETCLLPGVGAEVVLDGNLAVVKDNPFGNTAEILKYLKGLSQILCKHRNAVQNRAKII